MERLKYGKWYPIRTYYENKDKLKLDWALVQFKENKTGFMGLPHIAELRNDKWHLECDDEESYVKYINEDCEPIAFMLWQPYNVKVVLEPNKPFRIEYCGKVPSKKQRTHYTTQLKKWIRYNKGAWQWYPENYLPIKIFDTEKNELIFTIRKLEDVRIILGSTVEDNY